MVNDLVNSQFALIDSIDIFVIFVIYCVYILYCDICDICDMNHISFCSTIIKIDSEISQEQHSFICRLWFNITILVGVGVVLIIIIYYDSKFNRFSMILDYSSLSPTWTTGAFPPLSWSSCSSSFSSITPSLQYGTCCLTDHQSNPPKGKVLSVFSPGFSGEKNTKNSTRFRLGQNNGWLYTYEIPTNDWWQPGCTIENSENSWIKRTSGIPWSHNISGMKYFSGSKRGFHTFPGWYQHGWLRYTYLITLHWSLTQFTPASMTVAWQQIAVAPGELHWKLEGLQLLSILFRSAVKPEHIKTLLGLSKVQPTNIHERGFNVAVVIFALVTFSSFVFLGVVQFLLTCPQWHVDFDMCILGEFGILF